MVIALDMDGTYDMDPELWESFIKKASERGHSVVCVTLRTKTPEKQFALTYCTAGQAKWRWCRDHQVPVDIWIDDSPRSVMIGAYDGS